MNALAILCAALERIATATVVCLLAAILAVNALEIVSRSAFDPRAAFTLPLLIGVAAVALQLAADALRPRQPAHAPGAEDPTL